jgi:hypothetical protein
VAATNIDEICRMKDQSRLADGHSAQLQKTIRSPQVVLVQEANPFASGEFQTEIRIRRPIAHRPRQNSYRQLLRVVGEHLKGRVSRPVINGNDLDVRFRLRENAVERRA